MLQRCALDSLVALLLLCALAGLACRQRAAAPSGGGSAARATPSAAGSGSGARDAPPASAAARRRGEEALAALVAGKYAAVFAMFDETMRRAMPEPSLRRSWAQLLGRVGAFRRQLAVEQRVVGKYRLVLLTCAFAKGPLTIQLTLDHQLRISGLFYRPAHRVPSSQPARVPPYVDRRAFSEEQLTVGSPGWPLPATLSLPRSEGKLPAVVLVHGSGPHDRDETIGPNKPFRDIAWGLASRGIAALRYEKRTAAHAARVAAAVERITVKEETIDDALAAVGKLRRHRRVDPARVFVLGHSLGGMLLPRIALRDERLAGLIAVAANSRPLEDLIVAQTRYLRRHGGRAPHGDEALARLLAAAKRVKDPRLSRETPRGELPFNVPAAYWLDLRAHPPTRLVRRVRQPLLFLQGERDYQVTMVDFAGWRRALRGRRNAHFRSFRRANHLLIAGEGPSTPAEYQHPGHVIEAAITAIATFVKRQAATPPGRR